MKRKVSLWIGVVALASMIYVAGRTTAQQTSAPGGGEPRTRVAMINLTKVLKGYSKVTSFQEETKKMLQPYEEKAKGIQQQIEAHTKALQDKNLKPEQRETYEKNLKAYQRQMEDVGNDAKLLFGKKQEEQMVIVYREVHDAAQRVAVARGFEMVMHYNDFDVGTAEYFSSMNIGRKLQAGACIPMYIAPGMDITDQVVVTLNQAFKPGGR